MKMQGGRDACTMKYFTLNGSKIGGGAENGSDGQKLTEKS